MKNEKFVDLIIWSLIAIVGLVAAYVCFGVLSSEADGKFESYSVGGAIAGALVSWSVLTSVYLQLRGSSNELKELRDKADELQKKLIRGAPRPFGFITEVDERQRLVLARPEVWQPKGGVIFDLELPNDKLKKKDHFAAAFRCYYFPIEKTMPQTKEEFYKKELDELKSADDYVKSFSQELVQIGDENSGVESLKIIARQFVEVKIEKKTKLDTTERQWDVIPLDIASGYITDISHDVVETNNPVELSIKGYGFRSGTIITVNGKERQSNVVNFRKATVALEEDDVRSVGDLDIKIKHTDIQGIESLPFTIHVIEKLSDSQNGSDQERNSSGIQSSDKEGKYEDNVDLIIQEVVRMRVFCFNKALKKVFVFEFWDDVFDFHQSSSEFNKVLASTRFLI